MGYGGVVVGDISGAAVNEAAAARPQTRADPGLHRRLLVPASGAWVVLAALALGTMVASLPSVFEHLRGARLTPEAVKQLQAHGLTPDAYATYVLALETLLAGTAFVVGAVVAWRRSDDRGALFVAAMLVTFGPTWSTAPTALAAGQPGWIWAVAVVRFVGDACFFAFCYVFPDGRLVPRWTLPLAVAAVAVAFARRVFPGGLDAWPDVPEVLPLVVFLATGIAAQVHRYRRASTPAQRQQTKWVVLGTAVALGGFLGLMPLFLFVLPPVEENVLVDLLGRTLLYGLMLLIPLSLAMAVLRYRLWDIDLVVNRALIYGGLTAGVVALYLGVVGALGALSQANGSPVISFAAAGVVAVLFQPLRVRLQRGVNRLLYGERDDPYTVLSRLGDRLGATLTPHAVLPAIVDTVREALKAPYAAVALKEGDAFVVAARSGSPGVDNRAPLRLPLAHQGEVVGELLLGHRAGEERFGFADRRLLDDLAHHAGVAAHAVRLSADLQRSRERLVGAREEERRRLRRDLHDGLGPALSSAMLKVGAARRQLPPDAAVDGLLAEVREDLRGVVADVRRLVYDLRPPALDQLGLPLAVRALAEQCGSPGEGAGGSALRVEVEAPERLPPLPAAVEVAAYRIAQEALTNVVRHARASVCMVRLALEEPPGPPEPADESRGRTPTLRVEVTDDGVGLPPRHRPGVGLASMRERAAELGGTCTIAALPAGGTRVLARLPVAEA